MKLKNKFTFSGLAVLMFVILIYVIYHLDQDSTFNAQNDNISSGLLTGSTTDIKEDKEDQVERKYERKERETQRDPIMTEAMQTLDNEIISRAEVYMGSSIFREKYSNPRNFALLEWNSGMSYEMVRDYIKEDQLPVLYEMLKDKNYTDHWDKIARMIAYISKDPKSVPVLLEYLQRDDSWSLKFDREIERAFNNRKIMGKIAVLSLIGIIGGEQANAILKEAISDKGAEKLISDWKMDSLTSELSAIRDQKEVTDFIRGSAILGIVFSEQAENIEMIKNLYEIEESKCRQINNLSEERSTLHNSLVESMGKLDYITEHSLEKYLSLEGESSIKIKLSYASKYCPVIEDLCKKLNIETK